VVVRHGIVAYSSKCVLCGFAIAAPESKSLSTDKAFRLEIIMPRVIDRARSFYELPIGKTEWKGFSTSSGATS
jgi:hypothetical protein